MDLPAFRHHLATVFHKRLRSGSQLRKSLSLVFLSVAFSFFGLAAAQFYHFHVASLPEGSVFWGEDLSGMTRSAAQDLVQSQIETWSQEEVEIVLKRDGAADESFAVPLADLGFVYDVSASVQAFFQISSDQLSADMLHGAAEEVVSPVVSLEDEAMNSLLDRLLSHQERPQSARLSLDEEQGAWVLSADHQGFGLLSTEQDHLADELYQLATTRRIAPRLEFSLTKLDPEVSLSDLQPLYDELQQLLQKKVRWQVDGYEVEFSLKDEPWIVEVDEETASVFVSEAALRSYIDEWSLMFDRPTGRIIVSEPVMQEAGYLRAAFDGQFENGRQLDQEALFNAILAALDAEEEVVEIELPYTQQSAQVVDWDGRVLDQLSQGRSSYALAHSDDRLFNVKFGLSKYDGVVIPQGAEFDFNQILGWVTYEAGWKPALAIFGGGGVKPVPGGGLCQVSTTMYRAAVLEGLPVSQRRPHSLDVSYYHAYGDGIDSTIYPPEDINLKFINDTPGPIVIHTYVDETAEEAFVEFYGVDDGRSVTLEQTINRPVKLPGETVYTPDLPAGVTEVISPRAGRYVEWEWDVTYADGSVDERTIETLYPARRQTIRVGIAE